MRLLVDVIVPTFNRLRMLQEAVASIRAQHFADWQLVVADNGSTDGTQQWLEGEGITWVSASIRGAGAARNAGIAATNNPLIYFLDSDDLATPTALEILVRASQESGAEICYGVATNQVLGRDLRLHEPTRATPAPLASTSLIRREAFAKYGPFDSDNFSWPAWYLRSRDLGLTEFAVFDEICQRRIHGANVSSEAGAKSVYFDLIRSRLQQNRGDDARR